MDRAHTESPRWHIAPLNAPQLEAVVEVSAEPVTLGRHPASEVVLSQSRYPGVSGRHAQLQTQDGVLVLKDLGSRNGTLVGGRPVEEHALEHGEIFQLGPEGPRFVAVSSAFLDQTAPIAAGTPRPRSIGPETVELVREHLGLPVGGGVEVMLKKRERRIHFGTVGAAVLVVAGIAIAYIAIKDDSREVAAAVQKNADKMAQEWEARLGALRESTDNELRALETQQAALKSERGRLEARIKNFEGQGGGNGGELAELRQRLEETDRTLELFSPVNLEQSRLREVERMEQAVVMIEAKVSVRETASGKLIYMNRSISRTGASAFNTNGNGSPMVTEGTGSGFCLNDEGWILTNAHVVFQKGDNDVAKMNLGKDYEPDIELFAVFSGDDTRHPARLVSFNRDGNDDLALLKIEPFTDMPHIDGIDLDQDRPLRGTEVFLIGFPLGKRVLQEGDTMIASAFKGIVSRSVDYYLQVDAAIHPGASGGPVIDTHGRVIGVVVGMQPVTREASSSVIGYIIPIEEAGKLWPPPEEKPAVTPATGSSGPAPNSPAGGN